MSTKTNTYEDREEGTSTMDQDEMMERMQAAGKPGAEHKALDALKGDWRAEVKCWMEPGGGGQPTESKATSKANWVLSGRFLEEEFRGEMMGQAFTGRCLLGFDNTKRKFQCVWVDDMNTAMFCSEGTGDSSNKVITLEGKADCPMTGQKDVPTKQVFRVLSPDKHTVEMFNNNQKTMEITYTRQ